MKPIYHKKPIDLICCS